jgi:branched-chain amino acid transport system substrate-binding protein
LEGFVYSDSGRPLLFNCHTVTCCTNFAGEQIDRPLGYANNAGIWGLIWEPKIDTDGSRRFIQGVIDKYNHTPTSRCYLGYAAMTQILEPIQRAGTTDTAALIKALEGHGFDG